MRFSAGKVRTNSSVTFSYGLLLMDTQVLAEQQRLIYRVSQYIWDSCDCPIISAHLVYVYICMMSQYSWDLCNCQYRVGQYIYMTNSYIGCLNILGTHVTANIGCLNIHGIYVAAIIGCLNKHWTYVTANIGCLNIHGNHVTANIGCLTIHGNRMAANIGCLNLNGTYVITNNSTYNNIVFFFVSDLNIVYNNNF